MAEGLDRLEVLPAFPEHLVGRLQAPVGFFCPLVHPARCRSDLVREPSRGPEVQAEKESLRPIRQPVDILGGVLDDVQAVHARLGVMHGLAEQASPGVRHVRDALGEVFHPLEHPSEETALPPRPLTAGPLVPGRLVPAG